MRTLLTTTIVVLFLPVISAAQQLQPLKYNNPGLAVDLGVGLWAWPVPCDADGDGDYDLLVACPDKPSNGVWFF
ncbi:MAG: VCBS repeat-containing protein, partial [Planctomycetaceae bacterium]|nr:VCBS repeat-containing protein [Planctomycetaceae bacterium]